MTASSSSKQAATGRTAWSSGMKALSSGLKEHWLFAKRSMASWLVRYVTNSIATSRWGLFEFTLTRVSTLTTSAWPSSNAG